MHDNFQPETYVNIELMKYYLPCYATNSSNSKFHQNPYGGYTDKSNEHNHTHIDRHDLLVMRPFYQLCVKNAHEVIPPSTDQISIIKRGADM
jgi:hypothetical protein